MAGRTASTSLTGCVRVNYRLPCSFRADMLSSTVNTSLACSQFCTRRFQEGMCCHVTPCFPCLPMNLFVLDLLPCFRYIFKSFRWLLWRKILQQWRYRCVFTTRNDDLKRDD
ncbi:hypothetical protein JG688_00011355 [Phytophthora aleatoria]|uniref:Uncharacterized protein n=1 Tax=Phytophthora aleatoria TaxID=2496075 RepID=A0A8J5J456_9STRA|nr:hypothetical protein JG688_00011355 [Phytophthora aleatoria]